jgi:acetate kinase
VRVLVLNPGSSSLKASLIDSHNETTLAETAATWDAADAEAPARARILAETLAAVTRANGGEGGPDAVGYRVVHGGTAFREAVLVDAGAVEKIEALDELAPLHNRIAAETIQAARQILSSVPHVACFDTAFHASLDEAAWRYPIPSAWHSRWGIRRFGFHGLSVAWAAERAASLLKRPVGEVRLVVAHLGAGSSVTAVEGGRSVDTSMGFTPLEGLMMGTRSGSIDPGILLHLLRHGVDVGELADALEHGSGLLGVSGRTSDVAELERVASAGNAPAALALELYSRRAAAGVAAVATSLPSIDALVFTGGIGEHAAAVRARICARLGPLGMDPPDVDRPEGRDAILSAGPIAILVVQSREDIVIARQVAAIARGR